MEEQYNLCAYCEREIDENNTHIEHIKPKSGYLNRCFDYNNLIASCEGDKCSDVNVDMKIIFILVGGIIILMRIIF